MKINTLTALALLPFVGAAGDVSFERGNWQVRFSEKGAVLRLENAANKVAVEGKLEFASGGRQWGVVEARDAATDRLSLVSATAITFAPGTVLGYVSFPARRRRQAHRLLERKLHARHDKSRRA